MDQVFDMRRDWFSRPQSRKPAGQNQTSAKKGGWNMHSNARTTGVSRTALWSGRIISAALVLFLLFDGITKLIQDSHVVEGMALLGYPGHLIVPVGIVVLACTVIYVIPRTAILGAILLTGHLGGATASMLRVGDPHHPYFFPVVFGILVWLGLYLRDDRLRKLVPIRKEV